MHLKAEQPLPVPLFCDPQRCDRQKLLTSSATFVGVRRTSKQKQSYCHARNQCHPERVHAKPLLFKLPQKRVILSGVKRSRRTCFCLAFYTLPSFASKTAFAEVTYAISTTAFTLHCATQVNPVTKVLTRVGRFYIKLIRALAARRCFYLA